MNFVRNLFFFVLAIISSFWISSFWLVQTFTPSSSYQPVEVIDGAGLYKKQRTDGNEAYLQVIDLQKMQIDQLVGEVDNMGLGQGKYYQGEGEHYSPFFKMKLFDEITDEYKELYSDAVFSLINCSFFEQYKSSSQLSFELYDGDKRIEVISPRTASDGVYEWTPNSPVKEGYSLRITSLKNRKILGTLQL